ncbi:response regulator transcription factor [Lewinella sp. W8]|uniref:response regulator transcription factor n=1 Tax=Lewinella sp. W8 TaxID=2528208 RepID=UPI001067F8F4|nr:LuxR C-terminal-related transcriptional regulator [Lewinella sp. W8]MTB49982.1 hypothetical protein [Lewinella sp. W8]
MNKPNQHIPLADNVMVSPQALRRLTELQRFARANRRNFSRLSRRELEILALICQGLTNEEIAARLYRSVHTIRTHRNNIWRQLGIRSVVEAVKWGQAFDLV